MIKSEAAFARSDRLEPTACGRSGTNRGHRCWCSLSSWREIGTRPAANPQGSDRVLAIRGKRPDNNDGDATPVWRPKTRAEHAQKAGGRLSWPAIRVVFASSHFRPSPCLTSVSSVSPWSIFVYASVVRVQGLRTCRHDRARLVGSQVVDSVGPLQAGGPVNHLNLTSRGFSP